MLRPRIRLRNKTPKRTTYTLVVVAEGETGDYDVFRVDLPLEITGDEVILEPFESKLEGPIVINRIEVQLRHPRGKVVSEPEQVERVRPDLVQ